ncbi:right-handed parallel beta-helix repeat-containing protein [uncultured Bifidobacterium sp.]|uniref:right-handed parallel beta-helix repeat-containing protein n=1 Tax=uncultured Bifidobacterium sp. TaxID=165187 RepID=UPI00259617D1|nr:right-handed parallel beta-helix repeat-containing protein [uncultured Bifidobacterium sp.]
MAFEYHVRPDGDDLAVGDVLHPFATISKAAAVARPGDTVIVHDGVYREQVDPAHRGISDLERITYRAADGEHPVIKGSERITAWEHDHGDVWRVTLPNTFFGDFNPYREPIFGDWLNTPDHRVDKPKHLGDVYLNGRSFYEVTDPAELDDPQVRTTVVDNALQVVRPVDDPDQTRYVWYCEVDEHAGKTTIWANFHGADPNVELVEINVRRSCFFPSRTHIDYISVIGFEMAQAACPWAPPTAPQIGMVGPNWARGWVIADNHLHDAKCSAVCLGKEESTGDNEWYRTDRKTGYQYQLEAVFKGLRIGWSKGVVGGHRVVGNTIHDCGQNAIVGHMGCAFSTISRNHCYRIGLKREFFGWEVAGIKFHAAIDTVIDHNDIHDCSLGLWLDWQAQNTRVSANVFHHNVRDTMIEVSHGPCLLDNNVFASPCTIQNFSQGLAFVNNLVCGTIDLHRVMDRSTPYHFPHSTEVAGCAFVSGGDDRYRNNLFTAPCGADDCPGLAALDAYAGYPTSLDGYIRSVHEAVAEGVQGGGDPYPVQPLYVGGNAYCGVQTPDQEPDALHTEEPVSVQVEETPEGVVVTVDVPAAVAARRESVVRTADLGTPRIVEALYENPDGSPITFDADITGERRDGPSVPGPFVALHAGVNRFVCARRTV